MFVCKSETSCLFFFASHQEVNDVLQRVSGERQPVPLWRTASTEDLDAVKEKEVPFMYSFRLNLKVTDRERKLIFES